MPTGEAKAPGDRHFRKIDARSRNVKNLPDDDLRRNPFLVEIVILKQRI